MGLDTSVLDAGRIVIAKQKGVVCCELFAGIMSGTEALLKDGFRIERLICIENDPAVQTAMNIRVKWLRAEYPQLLSFEAVMEMKTYGEDIRSINMEAIRKAVEEDDRLWVVVAGAPTSMTSLMRKAPTTISTRIRF